MSLLRVFRFCALQFMRCTWMVSGLALCLSFPLHGQAQNPAEQHGAPPLACGLELSMELYPGDPVTVKATVPGLNLEKEAKKYLFKWNLLDNVVGGNDDTVTFVAPKTPGSYTVLGTMSEKRNADRYSRCGVNFTVTAIQPPTIGCSANPSTIFPGDSATIKAMGVSPRNRPLSYSYAASKGSISGNTSTGILNAAGVWSGTIAVTCYVVDDQGQSASAATTVHVYSPPATAAATPTPPPPPLPSNPMWPVPPPSGHKELTMWPLGRPGLARMGDVANKLETALSSVGYVDRGYYSIPGGFALVTKVEQIYSDGTPKPPPDRFSSVLSGPHSLADYLKALFTTQPGYYRILVFVVTDQTIPYGGPVPTQEDANRWLGAPSTLPASVASEPTKSEAKCTVMIYEFENSGASNDPATLMTSMTAGAEDHLRKSGVWAAMNLH